MASVDRGVPPEGLNDLGPTGSGSSCSGCTRLTADSGGCGSAGHTGHSGGLGCTGQTGDSGAWGCVGHTDSAGCRDLRSTCWFSFWERRQVPSKCIYFFKQLKVQVKNGCSVSFLTQETQTNKRPPPPGTKHFYCGSEKRNINMIGRNSWGRP